MTLTNRFILIGSLSEARIDLFRSHVKLKLAIDINGYIITVYSTISKRFNKDKYESIMNLIPQLKPKSGGWVYVNGENKYYEISQSPDFNKLFISGNIVPLNRIMLFNFEYIKKVNNNSNCGIKINLEGQFVDNNKLVNIVYDSPRLFEINPNRQIRFDKIYSLELKYCPEYYIKNVTVESTNINNQFRCVNIRETNKSIQKDQMDEYMVEWDIINNEV